MVSILEKTLLSAYLVDGFWDRWIAHGANRDEIFSVRPTFTNIHRWLDGLLKLAASRVEQADRLYAQLKYKEAESNLCIASLYYNLAQWIFPNPSPEKKHWYRKCQETLRRADTVSTYKTKYARIPCGEFMCEGRVRFPEQEQPKGCVILVNPLDSNKEEMFTYEQDFLDGNFITVCVDGPGQGATYTYFGFGTTVERWYFFMERLIDYVSRQFPELPLYLFGTSSGATWAIYGGKNEKITKVAAVSPAMSFEETELPIYFAERMQSISDDKLPPLPTLEPLPEKSVLLFHGKKDVMTKTEHVYQLYQTLSDVRLVEYEDEGHCCNFKLGEVRRISMDWFEGRWKGDHVFGRISSAHSGNFPGAAIQGP